MNILIILSVIFGVALAQRGDTRDCNHGVASERDFQDIYQRPSVYDSVDYNTPHTSYGPPDPVRSPHRRNYPQDTSQGENNHRQTYAQAPSYSEIRPAPGYGPPPSRSRAAAAAGIYDDYEDNLYSQSAFPPPPPPQLRRYNLNYAHREPYFPRYDAYPIRRPEYRVPVYYAPLIPHGFIPVHSHSPIPETVEKPTTTEESRPQSTPESYQSEHQHTSSTEQETYEDDGQVRRHHPTIVAVNTSPSLQNEIKRHFFNKPFLGLRNLFRGSILRKRNKIGLIPSLVQGSTSNL